MSKILSSYNFKGFGFDVILKNITVKKVDGEEYPAINLNEVKNTTAKALLTSKQRLTGYQIKFLRTYLRMSFDEVAEEIHVAASTLRSWENKGGEFTGFDVDHEKAFRIMAVNKILEKEKARFNIEVTLVKEFKSPAKLKALDTSLSTDFFVSND